MSSMFTFILSVLLLIPLAMGHIGPSVGYFTRSVPPCEAGPTHLSYPPVSLSPPYPITPYQNHPPPPYQQHPPPQNCRSCPWRNPLPPMIPPPQIVSFKMAHDSYSAHLPPIPASDKYAVKENNVETKVNNPFEETPPVPKISLPATLSSEDANKEQSPRPLIYETKPARYSTYPTLPEASAFQPLPPPVPLPPTYNCKPYSRPVYPNSPPPYTLRPLQPPPLNNCCARCDRGCKHIHAHRRAFVSKTKNSTDNNFTFFDNLDFNNPNECTSRQLKAIIFNNAALNMTKAKETIQRTAEKELGDGVFHVICSSADLEYTTRTLSFCFGEVADGVCYVFRTN